ncbi:MAG TPA: type II toxin-antitoxin system HicA family toxin [Dehalococcoidia bacterium]|jgi:predicted RNA binding protein YcfA (HicA-like mRNA interferase family)|nr:type II toxin-antitoxin system HicA family toxin [Dehalococcoidia bacterium]
MARFPALQAKDVIRALEALGFEIVRQRGSQARLRHPDARVVTVPVHRGQDVGRGLVRKILGDAQITPSQFLEALNKQPDSELAELMEQPN